MINSMAQQKKGLRLEQVFEYSLGTTDTSEWAFFFGNVFQSVMETFGLSCRLADTSDSTLLGLPSGQPYAVTLLNGIPLATLEALVVSHQVWPGLLVPYLRIFKPLIKRYFLFVAK